MKNSTKIITLMLLIVAIFLLMLPAMQRSGIFRARTQGLPLRPGTVVVPILVSVYPTENNLQLQTFPFVTATPIPTIPPTPIKTYIYPSNLNRQNLPTGKQYCVDEAPGTVLIESCDDPTRCDIAHGGGGVSGSCGTVISWEHKIIETLLLFPPNGYFNRLSTDLTSQIVSNCFIAEPFSPYISTFNVIDPYSLAGFKEYSRALHASATALESAWRATTGYTILTTANGVTPGDVLFFSNPPHTGIVNTVEIDSRGNGDMWFLHVGATYYLGKIMIANWQIVSSSTGDNNVVFGSHQSKGPDATIGETVCYCGSGTNECYRYTFK